MISASALPATPLEAIHRHAGSPARAIMHDVSAILASVPEVNQPLFVAGNVGRDVAPNSLLPLGRRWIGCPCKRHRTVIDNPLVALLEYRRR